MTTRLNININDETAAVLRRMADEKQTTVTEVVRRAVSVHWFFQQNADKEVRLVSPNGDKTKVVWT